LPVLGVHRGRKGKVPDRSAQDARNRALGLAGELAVITFEQRWLRENGREDLVEKVRHVSFVEGDGAGYDVASFELDGSKKFIEVKTTRDGAETDFFISANEVEFSKRHSGSFCLYRVYAFDPAHSLGNFYVRRGSLTEATALTLEPVQYWARVQHPAD
jgi:hypothetical protein